VVLEDDQQAQKFEDLLTSSLVQSKLQAQKFEHLQQHLAEHPEEEVHGIGGDEEQVAREEVEQHENDHQEHRAEVRDEGRRRKTKKLKRPPDESRSPRK
jgi:hypothetical protein